MIWLHVERQMGNVLPVNELATVAMGRLSNWNMKAKHSFGRWRCFYQCWI